MKKRILLVILSLLIAAVSTLLQGFTVTGAFDAKEDGRLQDLQETPLTILMYHAICPGRHERYVIPPETLEEDFKYIAGEGFTTVTVADLVNLQERNIPLPKKAVMLTFDDGSRTNFQYAFPLLKKYRLKAVMAVVGAYVDGSYLADGGYDPECKSYLTYEQIKEMHESGLVEIQNHTDRMHTIGKRNGVKQRAGESLEEYEAALSTDLLRLEAKLNEKCGIRCNAVAYPFGAYSTNTRSILQKLGYKAALTCNEGVNRITRRSDLFALKRYNRAWGRDARKLLKDQ